MISIISWKRDTPLSSELNPQNRTQNLEHLSNDQNTKGASIEEELENKKGFLLHIVQRRAGKGYYFLSRCCFL